MLKALQCWFKVEGPGRHGAAGQARVVGGGGRTQGEDQCAGEGAESVPRWWCEWEKWLESRFRRGGRFAALPRDAFVASLGHGLQLGESGVMQEEREGRKEADPPKARNKRSVPRRAWKPTGLLSGAASGWQRRQPHGGDFSELPPK